MKKTLVALLALGCVAMGENIRFSDTLDISGDQSANRYDFDFDAKTDNRTITLNVTGDTIISSTDGYGLENASSRRNHNILILNIETTLTSNGIFKGTGMAGPAITLSEINIATELLSDELTALTSQHVSRDVLVATNIQSVTNPTMMTLTIGNAPAKYANGGLIVKAGDAFYSLDDVTAGTTWSVNSGAQAMSLAADTVYTYVKLDSATAASNVKAIGFLVTPEPATATLSLLALAGLAARRRRH